MKKIIFKKLLREIFFFFLISSLALTSIIWVIQAVNFLDTVSEDGHSFKVYFSYTLLTIPRVFNKIMPHAYWGPEYSDSEIKKAIIESKLKYSKPKNLLNYPQIRAKVWTKKMLFINALGWFLYLFGYEFLFRGILLIPLVEALGMWPAIAINIALYSATHIPKGLDETLGAIPLGFVLCLLTISSGTIWIAFIVHVVMAWTNTFTALKFHPDMRIQK